MLGRVNEKAKKRPGGIEPSTSQSAIECSTTELQSPRCFRSDSTPLESPNPTGRIRLKRVVCSLHRDEADK